MDRDDVRRLRWPFGTTVSLHHHGVSDAAFVRVSGALRQARWVDPQRVERPLTEDEGAMALSVHVYSPPSATMAYFDDEAERVLLEASVDQVRDAFSVAESAAQGPSGIDRMLAQARERIAPRSEAWDVAAAMADGALVIDTRPTELRQRDGELTGAVVIERNVLEWRLDPTSPFCLRAATDPNRPVIVVCDEGYASSLAAASLLDLGRSNVTDLKGGYQAWKRHTPESDLSI